MPGTEGTAYLRLKSALADRDLCAIYTPSAAEILLARRASHGAAARLGFLVVSSVWGTSSR